jgi:DUF4097 and DUF4098 domain-containing protein YvlB
MRTLLAAVLAVASVGVARANEESADAYVERSDLAADVRGAATLVVNNTRGDVRLRPSADGRLHLGVTKIVHMPNAREAHSLAARTTVQAGIVGGRYVVKVNYPDRIEAHLNFWDLFSSRGRKRFHYPSLEVLVIADVPAGMAAEVNTVSGDVGTEDITGPATIGTVSGDVNVRGTRGASSIHTVSGSVVLEDAGSARVHTSSGDIRAAGAGALDCRTVSGDIDISAARDSLRLETSSGDVTVTEAPVGIRARSASGELAVGTSAGRVELASMSGDVRVRLRAPLRDADIGSTSGDVLVDLVPGTSGMLGASSTSGSIDCRAPIALLKRGRNSLDARLGNGGPPIRIHSVSGDLTVTSGGK